MRITQKISRDGNPAVLGLAMVAGLGLTLVIVALGIGVIEGSNADGNVVGLLFAAGVALFLLGAIGWFGVTQPQKHFDDINLPLEDEHHGHAAHTDEHAEAAHTEQH